MENMELRFCKAVNKEQNENLRRYVKLCGKFNREDKRSIKQKWKENDIERNWEWDLIKCMWNMFRIDGSTWSPAYYCDSMWA